jgi:1,4-dihydroxy-2-naphthoate octaprenyltransferase
VAVGTAAAIADGVAQTGPALAALFGALCLQIGANLANDVFDAEKGADGESRLGPPRATQQGWLSPGQVKKGMAAAFALAALAGVYLIGVAGWPIAAVGVAAIAAAITYTGGPWPFGYHGLGELFVFLFFGVVAVCGSYYVQALELSDRVLLVSLPVGALATAVLVVNNLRDIEGDRRAGKNTLAVMLGVKGARSEYLVFVLGAYVSVGWASAAFDSLWLMLPLATVLRAGLLVGRTRRESGPALNEVLAATAQLALLFSLLLALGIVL